MSAPRDRPRGASGEAPGARQAAPASARAPAAPGAPDAPPGAVATRVLATLCRIAPDVDPDAVDRGAPLVEQLDLDSLDYQNLLAALSVEHGVAIPELDVAGLTSVDAIVAYLEAHAPRAG